MRRKLILTAIGATTLSIGFGVGATLATDNSTQRIPTVSTMMTRTGNMEHMCSSTGMASMMRSAGMDSDTMAASHTEMHAAMGEHMSAETLAACDSAHRSMMDGSSMTSSESGPADSSHRSHHAGARP
jgi:hypothetical protein